MLICKNCDTENKDGTVKCRHCKMGDKLVYVRPDANNFVTVKVDHNPLSCTNCGCESPGEGKKCRECKFPNAKIEATTKKTNGQPVLENLFNLLDEEDVKQLN